MFGRASTSETRLKNNAGSHAFFLLMILWVTPSLFYPTSLAKAAIIGSGDVTPDPSSWASSTCGLIGQYLTGKVTVDEGSNLLSLQIYLGLSSGSSGSLIVTGRGSTCSSSSNFSIGSAGNGTLDIEAGAQVSNAICCLGIGPGTTGTATVSGTGSKWSNSNNLYVGLDGSGTLTVNNGGVVTVAETLFSSLSSLMGNGTITTKGAVLDADFIFDAPHGLQKTFSFGSGGILTFNEGGIGELGVGYKGKGTLKIADGMAVTSACGYVGYQSGSTGTATVTGIGSHWISDTSLNIGYNGSGSLTIEVGGQVSSSSGCLGGGSSATGMVTVSGTGSEWSCFSLDIGHLGSGTLRLEAGGQVSTFSGSLGSYSGSTGTATVTGIDSKWTSSDHLVIGREGSGTFTIEAGGQVSTNASYLGLFPGSSGTAMITGSGSKWTNSKELYVGDQGRGTLTMGSSDSKDVLVTAKTLYVAANSESMGTFNINGGTLQVGTITKGSGTAFFNWNDGTIRNYDASTNLSTISTNLVIKLASTGTHAFYIDPGRYGVIYAPLSDATSNGTLTKTGEGLLTLSGGNSYSGETVVEAGTLTYGGLYAMSSGPYTVKGGTLDIGSFSKSIAAFRMTGGTVNGTGTLTSNAPYDLQAGTVNLRLAGKIGLNKTGEGLLTLTAANTYIGQTTIEAGRLKVTGSIFNTSGVTVDALATLELARSSGSVTAANLAMDNDGTLIISAGLQTVGAIHGIGITQVNAGATLTASSIVQDSLFIGTTGMVSAREFQQVPEPSTWALLLFAAAGVLVAWRRRVGRKARPIQKPCPQLSCSQKPI